MKSVMGLMAQTVQKRHDPEMVGGEYYLKEYLLWHVEEIIVPFTDDGFLESIDFVDSRCRFTLIPRTIFNDIFLNVGESDYKFCAFLTR